MAAALQKVTNLYGYKHLKGINPIERDSLRISADSIYSDLTWDYSSLEMNPNVKATGSILRWDFPCGNSETFDQPRFDNLRESFKELIYSLAANPARNAPAPATLKKEYNAVRALMKWLIANGFNCISKLVREDTNPYIAHVNAIKAHPLTKVRKLAALKRFWEHRADITNPLGFDPLPGKTAFAASGASRDDLAENKYDFIPDDTAQQLIRSCVTFIREKGDFVAAAMIARDTANLDQIKRGKSKANRDRAKRAALAEMGITNAEVSTLSRQLLASCYLVIGFFTGVRASEMLSLVPGQIIKENGVVWVHGRQFKISNKARRWMAPDIVFEAHQLAKVLTQPMRDAIQLEIDNTEDRAKLSELQALEKTLFLNWSSKRKHGIKFEVAPQVSNIKSSIFTSLKELVELFDVVDLDGEHWSIHPHQLRKTFVRFMCSNAMNIRYLQEHMGHRSLDMTAWYDSQDIELTKEILAGVKEYKKAKLGEIFYGQKNASGAAAKSIDQERRDYFVGIASDRDRDVFIADLAEDMTMRSTGHSWCLGDSNNGSCTGVVGCMMDITMTQRCKSALITEDHMSAWLDIKVRNEKLLESDQIGKYQKEAVRGILEDTIYPTIAALRDGNMEALSNG